MKYGFIGCGNMGGAIARSLAKSTKDIMLTDVSDKAALLADELGCTHSDNLTVCKECDRIFLAVKPQNLEAALKPLQSILQERKPLLISMAAGMEIKRVQSFVGCPLPIVRIMPNTPVAVGSGLILYCCNDLVDPAILQDLLADATPCGTWTPIAEQLVDAAGVVSGCGPAYMYMFMDAFAKAAASCGVPEQDALGYAAATMIGAARMVMQTGKSPEDLKNAVCSPGGSTIAGVRALENAGFADGIFQCVQAAYLRNQELGKLK